MKTLKILNSIVFKKGAGKPLNHGSRIRLHYSIALSVEDLHSERFVESSYWSDTPIVGMLGENGSFSNIVNAALIKQNSLCTVRIIVDLSDYSLGVPQSVVVELWPDSDMSNNDTEPRFSDVYSYEPTIKLKEANNCYDSNNLCIETNENLAWVNKIINSTRKQSSGSVIQFKEGEYTKFLNLTEPLKTEINWADPKSLGNEQYLLTNDLVKLIKERLLCEK